MHSLTFALFIDSMSNERWSALAGAVSCALYNVGDAPDGTLDRGVLADVMRRLPNPIWEEAVRRGFDDDLVGHNVVNFLQARFEELGSLEALLQSPAVH